MLVQDFSPGLPGEYPGERGVLVQDFSPGLPGEYPEGGRGRERSEPKSALGRIRTCDTRFRKPVLYPLSYEGEGGGG